MHTLLLTPWMSPHKIISWERAVVLTLLGKVDVLAEHPTEIRSMKLSLMAPSVVRLRKGGVATKQTVRFTRVNVFTRDGFRCQYCGQRKAPRELNYDHVLPRVRGGRTTWDNIVTSCYPCNDQKGSRTPEEAGMVLRKRPNRPRSLPMTAAIRLGHAEIPEEWTPYCVHSGELEISA